MDNKAQGALEYLLLIGGAVLIAAVVIALLAGLGTTGSDSAHSAGHIVNSELQNINNLI
jgi:uncharacterized protein (UPF0333 family)